MVAIPEFDPFIAEEIRDEIERRYYARVNQQCVFEQVLNDADFLDNPSAHAALFADHGVVHVRDVTHQLLHVLDLVNGLLIPHRGLQRLTWMKAYGAFVASVHDIGMIYLTPEGRKWHPEFAAQAVLGATFDEIFDRLWKEDRGGIAARLTRDAGNNQGRRPELVLREMLAMANCHSKSKVPITVLNDRARLREAMKRAATVELPTHRQRDSGPGNTHDPDARSDIPETVTAPGGRPEAFAWLEAPEGPMRELADDVVDTLRVLRCADALRQRGTEMKTSGNYEVFVDPRTASAVFALRPDENHLYLLEIPDAISAGESNLSASQIEVTGDLRVSFHRGMFGDADTVLRAAHNAAIVVNDIQLDVIGSFERGDQTEPGLKAFKDIRILVESVSDNPTFADLVLQELQTVNPVAAERGHVVPSLGTTPRIERDRYVWGARLDWSVKARRSMIKRVAQRGHRTDRIDPIEAFREVRLIRLRAGETLVEAGTPSNFVYVPLGEGLRGRPLGGYDEFSIGQFVLVGVTGVIRGAARNASIVATRDLALLAIPKTVFHEHWNRTYDKTAFSDLFRE